MGACTSRRKIELRVEPACWEHMKDWPSATTLAQGSTTSSSRIRVSVRRSVHTVRVRNTELEWLETRPSCVKLRRQVLTGRQLAWTVAVDPKGKERVVVCAPLFDESDVVAGVTSLVGDEVPHNPERPERPLHGVVLEGAKLWINGEVAVTALERDDGLIIRALRARYSSRGLVVFAPEGEVLCCRSNPPNTLPDEQTVLRTWAAKDRASVEVHEYDGVAYNVRRLSVEYGSNRVNGWVALVVTVTDFNNPTSGLLRNT